MIENIEIIRKMTVLIESYSSSDEIMPIGTGSGFFMISSKDKDNVHIYTAKHCLCLKDKCEIKCGIDCSEIASKIKIKSFYKDTGDLDLALDIEEKPIVSANQDFAVLVLSKAKISSFFTVDELEKIESIKIPKKETTELQQIKYMGGYPAIANKKYQRHDVKFHENIPDSNDFHIDCEKLWSNEDYHNSVSGFSGSAILSEDDNGNCFLCGILKETRSSTKELICTYIDIEIINNEGNNTILSEEQKYFNDNNIQKLIRFVDSGEAIAFIVDDFSGVYSVISKKFSLEIEAMKEMISEIKKEINPKENFQKKYFQKSKEEQMLNRFEDIIFKIFEKIIQNNFDFEKILNIEKLLFLSFYAKKENKNRLWKIFTESLKIDTPSEIYETFVKLFWAEIFTVEQLPVLEIAQKKIEITSPDSDDCGDIPEDKIKPLELLSKRDMEFPKPFKIKHIFGIKNYIKSIETNNTFILDKLLWSLFMFRRCVFINISSKLPIFIEIALESVCNETNSFDIPIHYAIFIVNHENKIGIAKYIQELRQTTLVEAILIENPNQIDPLIILNTFFKENFKFIPSKNKASFEDIPEDLTNWLQDLDNKNK